MQEKSCCYSERSAAFSTLCFCVLNLIENISVPLRFTKYKKNLIIVNQPVLVRFEIFTAESMTFDVSWKHGTCLSDHKVLQPTGQ